MTFFKFARISKWQVDKLYRNKLSFPFKGRGIKTVTKIRFIDGLSNAIDFRNMIILSFRDRYVH